MPTLDRSVTALTRTRPRPRRGAATRLRRPGADSRGQRSPACRGDADDGAPSSTLDAMQSRGLGYSSDQGSGQGAPPTSRTGFFLRARMQSALESGASYVNTALASASSEQAEQKGERLAPPESDQRRGFAPSPTSSSFGSSSHDDASSRRSTLTRNLKSKSASLLSAAAASIDRSAAPSPSQWPMGTSSSSSTTTTTTSSTAATAAPRVPRERRRHIVEKMRTMTTYTPSSSNRGVNNDEYRKHNLFPLPPPGHVQPILLPSYAIRRKVVSSVDNVNGSSADHFPQVQIDVRIDGFVEHWPERVSTSQRVFMQLARQLANLPRLPRQQPAPYHRHSTAPQSADTSEAEAVPTAGDELSPSYTGHLSSSPSRTGPTTPLHADTDDATFFPETPAGVVRRNDGSASDRGDDDDNALAASGFVEHALAHGAPDRAIGRVLQTMGALPIEGSLQPGWQQSVEGAAAQIEKEEAQAAQEAATHQGPLAPVGPLGGASVWANRSHEEVEKLWRTLDHRLRCFWTYRKSFQDVIVEIVPVFRDSRERQKMTWLTNEYGIDSERDEADTPPLLALTDVRSDAQGLFSRMLSIPSDKIEHYLAHLNAKKGSSEKTKRVGDIVALRMRARLASAGGHHNTTAAINAHGQSDRSANSSVAQTTAWQTLRISDDTPNTVHIICDIDDTCKHSQVLGGARAVTRNVFARPFEEVTIPGVKEWFATLLYDAHGPDDEKHEREAADDKDGAVAIADEGHAASASLVNHVHFVTNAPAEMHAIIKAYMSTAQLPAGTLLLKHYFSAGRSSGGRTSQDSLQTGTTGGGGVMAWLQTFMQPPSARKRQNLLRCLDDFPNTSFVLVGDSGEMDIEVYSELASERPRQVRAIWIRNVGNISSAAERIVAERAGAHQNKSKSEGTAWGKNAATGTKDIRTAGGTPAADAPKKPPPPDESLTRIQTCLARLPSTTQLLLWHTGADALDASVAHVRSLRAAPASEGAESQ